jgi:hypothetical protein
MLRRMLFKQKCPLHYLILLLLFKIEYGVYLRQSHTSLKPCIHDLNVLLKKEEHLLLDMKTIFNKKLKRYMLYIQEQEREEMFCSLNYI